MEINRSNYEIWFTDWLDGNLDSSRAELLLLFLEKNPDLREEFNDLTPVRLISPDSSYRHKENLLKSASDISQSQFEYLCAACLENDLDNDQLEELMEVVNSDPERKKTFDLIQRTKLAPVNLSFRHRSLLLKRTLPQKVMRFSLTVSAAAAAIALLIIIYSILRETDSVKSEGAVNKYVSETTAQNPSEAVKSEHLKRDVLPTYTAKRAADSYALPDKSEAVPPFHTIIKSSRMDSSALLTGNKEVPVNKITFHEKPEMPGVTGSNALVASRIALNVTDAREERLGAGKFISKTFREKILREKKADDTPLQGYDIAEAGVKGLNKLLGWQMTLDRKNDEAGQPKSIYFRSNILTINAPVKKRELQP